MWLWLIRLEGIIETRLGSIWMGMKLKPTDSGGIPQILALERDTVFGSVNVGIMVNDLSEQ